MCGRRVLVLLEKRKDTSLFLSLCVSKFVSLWATMCLDANSINFHDDKTNNKNDLKSEQIILKIG